MAETIRKAFTCFQPTYKGLKQEFPHSRNDDLADGFQPTYKGLKLS